MIITRFDLRIIGSPYKPMDVLKINELYNMERRAGWANGQQNIGFLPVHFGRDPTENQYLHWFVGTTHNNPRSLITMLSRQNYVL